jgi:hypothetical protein
VRQLVIYIWCVPESVREPSPVYPAGRVGTPADPNIPPGREGVELVRDGLNRDT